MTVRAALLVLLATATARADGSDADKLAAQGEELAKTGEYTRAIDAFKQADKLAPRARHACMIGLAYLRRELWPQAELFFETCKQRASLEDPLPDWFQDAIAQLRSKLDGTTVSAVTIRVLPEGSLAQITVSSFAPDEKFSPRTIHLAPGTHTIEVAAPNYPPQTRTFEVAPNTPLTVEVTLEHAGKRYVTPPGSKVPFAIMIGGGAAIAAGAIYHLAVLAPARDDAANALDYGVYTDKVEAFRTHRAATLGLYGLGVAAIATGLVLRATVFERTPILVGAEPTAGGGVISVAWTR